MAPGEKMSIAVIDWTRRDAAIRNEHTTAKEDLQHAALRDRTLTEAVHMVVKRVSRGPRLWLVVRSVPVPAFRSAR